MSISIYLYLCISSSGPVWDIEIHKEHFFSAHKKLFPIIKTKTPCLKDTVMLPLPTSIFLSHFLKISGSVASILLSSSLTFPGPLVPVSVHPGALVYLPLHDPTSASALPAVKYKRQSKCQQTYLKHQRVTDGPSMHPNISVHQNYAVTKNYALTCYNISKQ